MKLIVLICLMFNAIYGQYLTVLESAISPYNHLNTSISQSPFTLNIQDNDINLLSKSSNVYNIKDGIDYVESIYKQYLLSGVYESYLVHCHPHYDKYTRITAEQVNGAISNSLNELKTYIDADREVMRTTPNARFASRFMAQLVHENRFAELITQNLIKFNCINKIEAVVELPKFGLVNYSPAKILAKYSPVSCHASDHIKVNCNYDSKYPAYDGSCNNPYNAKLGMSYTCHKRLLPSDYSDGIKAFRKSISGNDLPNPRLISNVLLPDVEEMNPDLTQMVMQWGQSMVHDQTRTPQVLANAPLCCPPVSSTHPECSKIAPLPLGDSLTKIFNQTCLRQVRSASCADCNLGPRDSLNAATMYLDLSHLYGYTYNDVIMYRTFQRGLMAVKQDAANGDIFPTATGWFDPLTLQPCNVPKQFPQFQCFKNGDGTRGSQHPALNALITLLLRRHNQHATALSIVNPHWSDEQLYLEARRLLVAETNHITFNEYMEVVFSPELLNYFKLKPKEHGTTKYDPYVDPSTSTEWATAAGRFGHSQINNVFFVKNSNGEVYTFNMRDVFFEMSLIHLGQTEGIIKGLVTEPTMHVDPFFVTDVKDFMYQSPNRTTGLDLMVLNVHRGRDHGIPAYIYYLEYCFSYKVTNWDDLKKYIPERQIWRLQKIYNDVRDVDLFVGGISERRLVGNIMGPTFACLNGIQWFHTKYGDRYFYEHGGQSGSFTKAQLANIKATSTLSRLICKTALSIKSMQPSAFRMPNAHNNHEISCDLYPEFDYSLWKEILEYKK